MRSAGWVRRIGAATMVALAACGGDSVTGPDPVLPVPGIALTVPTALGVIQGGTTTLIIGITRTAYVGMVGMTLSGLPNGVTNNFSAPTSTNQLQFTLTASETATTGAATVTVTASGIDIPTRTATFVLNVAPK